MIKCPLHARHGITPAYAGKSTRGLQKRGKRRDHPRVCGEKVRAKFGHDFNKGSPPRMRGKAPSDVLRRSYRGITPAYAGKRNSSSRKGVESRDHPRVCGEKFYSDLILRITPGSPPRMRGKGQHEPCSVWRRGITPAYAGKSPCRFFSTMM